MARNKGTLVNIDNSNLSDYPNGRIKNNTGSGDGTPVNEFVYGDLHEAFAKLMRMYAISYNGLPDNETNGYQLVEALKSLASKNDYVIDLSTSGADLSVALKIGKLQNNEVFLLKATVNKGSETLIKGSDSVTKTVTYVGDFLIGEYVLMINTASGVTLIRQLNTANIDAVIGVLSYLKAASNVETVAGAITTKAVTPASFAHAFTDFVNGTNSPTYLATALLNGLYPKEHFAIVAGLGVSKERNYGTITGVDPGGGVIGSFYVVSGDIVSAELVAKTVGDSLIEVTMLNAMDDTNYEVSMNVESLGVDYNLDNDVSVPMFRKISNTVFLIALSESASVAQNLKLHVTVIQR